MALQKKNLLTTATLLSIILVATLTIQTIEAKGERASDSLEKIIMQDGVICRVNSSTGEATLLGVSEFTGNSFPDTIFNHGRQYIVNRIAPYCLWPARQNAPDSITLPNGIRYIDEKAFITMPYLRHVNLQEGLLTLGDQAFAFTDLRSIIFPQTLKEIGRGAFEGCHKLSEIDLSCVMYIDNEAFKDCAIRFLSFYTGNEVIGRDAFKGNDIFLLWLDGTYSPRAILMGFESIFGTSHIPWLGCEMSSSPDILYSSAPEIIEGRTGITFGSPYKHLANLSVPYYFSFNEDGSDEMKWRRYTSLWPMTDASKIPSRKGYQVFITPIRVRIDTSDLVDRNIKYKVLYNGEDVTSQMHGDTLILTEGKRMDFIEKTESDLYIRFGYISNIHTESSSYNYIDVVIEE